MFFYFNREKEKIETRKGSKAVFITIEIRPSFSVSQGKSSKELIDEISLFFKTASLNVRPDRNTVKYETRNLNHIISEVIPHFEKYPLNSNKQKDFLKFKNICFLLDKKPQKQITKAGRQQSWLYDR